MKKVVKIYCAMLFCTVITFGQNESNGKIHGYVFGDYIYNISRDANSSDISNASEDGEADLNGFQLRRIYLGYDYNINNKFSTRVRLEANNSEKTSGDKFGLFVKDAYIKWKNIIEGSDLVLGISGPPTFAVSESYWGYRSLAKTIMDLRKVAPSRDFGVSLKGSINSKLQYWVMFANGEGNVPEIDNNQRIYGHLAYYPIPDMVITVNSDFAFNDDIEDEVTSETLSNNKINTGFFIGYKKPNSFSLGLEGFYQIYQNALSSSNEFENQNSLGISVFGSADISEKFSLVGRYDYFDPVSNSNYEGDVRNFFLAALNYKADSKFWIMPNVVMESYENLQDGTEFDTALTGRITFFFQFN